MKWQKKGAKGRDSPGGADMTMTAINACAGGGGNIALAGKALEKIEALAASMGGELFGKETVKIDVSPFAVYITTTVKLPVSALAEYIARLPPVGTFMGRL